MTKLTSSQEGGSTEHQARNLNPLNVQILVIFHSLFFPHEMIGLNKIWSFVDDEALHLHGFNPGQAISMSSFN